MKNVAFTISLVFISLSALANNFHRVSKSYYEKADIMLDVVTKKHSLLATKYSEIKIVNNITNSYITNLLCYMGVSSLRTDGMKVTYNFNLHGQRLDSPITTTHWFAPIKLVEAKSTGSRNIKNMIIFARPLTIAGPGLPGHYRYFSTRTVSLAYCIFNLNTKSSSNKIETEEMRVSFKIPGFSDILSSSYDHEIISVKISINPKNERF